MKGDTQILKINEDERNRNIHSINLYHGKKESKQERKKKPNAKLANKNN